MPTVLSRFWCLLRQGRPADVLSLIGYGISEAYFEYHFGIHTLAYLTREELDASNSCSSYYAPTAYLDFRKAMRRLTIRENQDVFLDLGSGMGRAVIMAAMYPFRKVIGVELSRRLNEIAEQNLLRVRNRLKCKDVTLITQDASAYEFPPEATIVYLYNPFKGEVLARVMANIHESLRKSPRRLLIVYKNPLLLEQGSIKLPWLVKREEFVCLTGHKCIIYQNCD